MNSRYNRGVENKELTMNLNKEIQEAAELLKDEEILLGDTNAIASIIEDWLEEQLEEKRSRRWLHKKEGR